MTEAKIGRFMEVLERIMCSTYEQGKCMGPKGLKNGSNLKKQHEYDFKLPLQIRLYPYFLPFPRSITLDLFLFSSSDGNLIAVFQIEPAPDHVLLAGFKPGSDLDQIAADRAADDIPLAHGAIGNDKQGAFF